MLVALTRAALGAVLVAAGAAKFADLRAFQRTLSVLPTHILPVWTAPSIATGEVALGAMLFLQVPGSIVDMAVVLLTGGFLVFTVLATRADADIRCRCFGALSDARLGPAAIARNALLVISAILLLVADDKSTAPQIAGSWRALIVGAVALFALTCAQASRGLASMRREREGETE